VRTNNGFDYYFWLPNFNDMDFVGEWAEFKEARGNLVQKF